MLGMTAGETPSANRLNGCFQSQFYVYVYTVLPANNFGLGLSERIVSPNFVGIVGFRF